VWSGGVRAFQQGLQAEGQEPVLGDRTACALVLLRLAQLQLVAEPLAQLMQLLSSYCVGLTGAVAMLGSSTCELIIPPAQQMAALQLLEAVCATRCQAPDASELEALTLQLQGPEDASQAHQPSPTPPAANERLSHVLIGSADETPGMARLASAAGSFGSPPPQPKRQWSEEEWADFKRPWRRDQQKQQPQHRHQAVGDHSGRAGAAGRPTEENDGQAVLLPDVPSWPIIEPDRVDHWVRFDPKRSPQRTPAGDVGLPVAGGFPRSVGTSRGHRRELTELLLTSGIIYAAGEAEWPSRDRGARFRPAHALWLTLRPVAVDLDTLWAQLPLGVREFVQEDCGGGGGGVEAVRSGAGAGGGETSAGALAAFIARHCGALRMVDPVPPGRDPSAVLSAGWRAALLRHDLMRCQVEQLEQDVLAALRRAEAVPLSVVERLASRALRLYMQVRREGGCLHGCASAAVS